MLHALANDNRVDVLDCGAGNDVAFLNANDPWDRTINCETVNRRPTEAQETEENSE